MNHVDEGVLQAYLDDEVDATERLSIERHLGDCLSCRGELAEIRGMASELSLGLGLLDRPRPRARDYAVGLPRRPAAPAAHAFWALPRAAVLLLAFGAAAAAMVPGSPVYRWLRPPSAPAPEQVATTAPPEPGATVTAAVLPEAGVSVEPLDDAIRVVLSGAAPALRVTAVLTDGPRAGLFATGAAAAARFESAPGRVEATGLPSGELRVELPRSTGSAVVVVNGREYLRKSGDQLELLVAGQPSAGAEINFRP